MLEKALLQPILNNSILSEKEECLSLLRKEIFEKKHDFDQFLKEEFNHEFSDGSWIAMNWKIWPSRRDKFEIDFCEMYDSNDNSMPSIIDDNELKMFEININLAIWEYEKTTY